MDVLKLVFAGTPDFAARHLQALLTSHHDILAVYTQPDRPAGRGKQCLPSPVKALALSHNLPVQQPHSLRDPEEQAKLSALQPDLLIVVAYGLILPQAVLDIPRFGCINVHASLLPRWRGAAPIERAMLAGDTETGVTLMQMDAGLDTGDMLSRIVTPILPDDDRESLEKRLAELGSQGLLDCLDRLSEHRSNAEKQDDSQSTYARKLDKSEALIDWHQPAACIDRQIRAAIGRQPAYTLLQGERVRLLKASVSTDPAAAAPGTIVSADRGGLRVACGEGILCIEQLQLPGKNVLPIADVLNSRAALFAQGTRFDSASSSP